MTEAEWLACTEPWPMLEYLRGKASGRKRRLFLCACCRGIWRLLKAKPYRDAVEVAEQFADGLIGSEELARSVENFRRGAPGGWMCEWEAEVYLAVLAAVWKPLTTAIAFKGAREALVAAAKSRKRSKDEKRRARIKIGQRDRISQCNFIRDIFGDPFRVLTIKPAWLTINVVGLAESIYAERSFDNFPILADALEDAGCDNADILNHCRQPGKHVRGCWVVDLLLGKE